MLTITKVKFIKIKLQSTKIYIHGYYPLVVAEYLVIIIGCMRKLAKLMKIGTLFEIQLKVESN